MPLGQFGFEFGDAGLLAGDGGFEGFYFVGLRLDSFVLGLAPSESGGGHAFFDAAFFYEGVLDIGDVLIHHAVNVVAEGDDNVRKFFGCCRVEIRFEVGCVIMRAAVVEHLPESRVALVPQREIA